MFKNNFKFSERKILILIGILVVVAFSIFSEIGSLDTMEQWPAKSGKTPTYNNRIDNIPLRSVSAEPGFTYSNVKAFPKAKLSNMELARTRGLFTMKVMDDAFDYKVEDTIKNMKIYAIHVNKNGEWEKLPFKKGSENKEVINLIDEKNIPKENRIVISYDYDREYVCKTIRLTTVFHNNKGSVTYKTEIGNSYASVVPDFKNGNAIIEKNKFTPLYLGIDRKSKGYSREDENYHFDKYKFTDLAQDNTSKHLEMLYQNPKKAKEYYGNCYMLGVEFN